MWIDLFDANGDLVAQSDIKTVSDVGNNQDIPLDFAFSVDRGFFGLTWTILDNGVASDCSVGAATVALALTDANDPNNFFDFEFPCEDGQGSTAAVPLLDYVGSVSLNDATGGALGTADAANLSLFHGNELVDLGNFTFDVL